MFLGHYAVALAAKRAAPSTSLGTLLTAAQFLDLLWPILLLLGWEQVQISPGDTRFTPLHFTHYPISHSLLTSILWGLLFSLLLYARTHDIRSALVCALLVPSHWLLDAVVHRPDLPLTPGSSPRIGLALWNSIPATLTVEALLFLAGLTLYATSTRAKDTLGRTGFIAFVVVLLGLYAAAAKGDPPPGVQSLAWVSLGQWLFVLWAAWFDRHRESTLSPAPSS